MLYDPTDEELEKMSFTRNEWNYGVPCEWNRIHYKKRDSWNKWPIGYSKENKPFWHVNDTLFYPIDHKDVISMIRLITLKK